MRIHCINKKAFPLKREVSYLNSLLSSSVVLLLFNRMYVGERGREREREGHREERKLLLKKES